MLEKVNGKITFDNANYSAKLTMKTDDHRFEFNGVCKFEGVGPSNPIAEFEGQFQTDTKNEFLGLNTNFLGNLFRNGIIEIRFEKPNLENYLMKGEVNNSDEVGIKGAGSWFPI